MGNGLAGCLALERLVDADIAELVAEIVMNQGQKDEVKFAELYNVQVSDSTHICVLLLKDAPDEEPSFCYELSELILAKIAFTEVVILDWLQFSKPYQTVTYSSEMVPLLRRVHSPTAKSAFNQAALDLEAPNIIDGLSAALMLDCQHISRPCSVFLSLAESCAGRSIASPEVVAAFDPVFGTLQRSYPSLKVSPPMQKLRGGNKPSTNLLYL